ncbi:uncharacterized protein si:dkey-112e17.1 isoform X1 [Alosa sapidissima]|uniref:uncharacterized protein si:dkey-112e17.1 isoform X1 n=2 Tax=Alosa sapidissima TaxID=34773 RepID=UPI001C083B33|nr:uncharacterized protein si:dkey-112e17.1 isoform X1 [Alosa sapidissima]
MGLCMFRSTPVFIVSFLFWITGCAPQKVYFDCGAKVDVVDAQGLILSPGFPYNYSSGTHCVWQFFVPVGHQLIMEMFDFDVFENHNSQVRFAAISEGDLDEEMMDDSAVYSTERPEVEEGDPSQHKGVATATQGSSSSSNAKELQSSPKDEAKPVVVQEQSTKMEMAKVSNSAKWSSSSPPLVPSLQSPVHHAAGMVLEDGEKAQSDGISPQGLRADTRLGRSEFVYEPTSLPPSPTATESVSPETQQSQLDACPHDVLYISDLITFSSRFCGANRPASSQLVFGSSDDMVEVIMELITTTHWGRGFALLFHYRNQSDAMADQRSLTPTARKTDAVLAIVSGVAFFAVALSCVLFIIFRPKLCAKGASASPSSNPEVPQLLQNPGADVSELQLVPPNDPGQEAVPKNGNNNRSHSLSLPNTGLSFTAGVESATNPEQDTSSGGLSELELGTDEVFVISSGPSPSRLPFCPHTRERFLRHSDTGPSQVSDWPSPEPTAAPAGTAGSSSSSRPRAWSVRTFQDFLPPLPQLHKKWCSWNSTSPFTKLVDSAPSSSVADCQTEGKRKVFSDTTLGGKADTSQSDSSMSNASYPLAQPAQRQRRLNSTSNLRRTRFAAPCFGLLSGSPEGSRSPPGGHQGPDAHGGGSSPGLLQQQLGEAQAGKIRDFAGGGGGGDDHITVPVFAISEEEDRQPLVLAEHLSQSSVMHNGLSQGKRLTDGSALNGSVLSRNGKSEWRPWANSSTAEPGLLPAGVSTGAAQSALVLSNSLSGQIQLSSLSQ